MIGVALEARIRNPANILILLEPTSESNGVACMSLTTQTQRLQTQQKLLRCKGVQCRAYVAENLNTDTDGKGKRSAGLPELQAVIALSWLIELGESCSILTPVEFTAVDDNAGNSCPVSANPFGCAVHNNVGAVLNWTSKITASTEGIVNLEQADEFMGSLSDRYSIVYIPPKERPFHGQPWR